MRRRKRDNGNITVEIERARGGEADRAVRVDDLPARLGNLFEREERYTKLPGDYDAVKAFVLAEAARG